MGKVWKEVKKSINIKILDKIQKGLQIKVIII